MKITNIKSIQNKFFEEPKKVSLKDIRKSSYKIVKCKNNLTK